MYKYIATMDNMRTVATYMILTNGKIVFKSFCLTHFDELLRFLYLNISTYMLTSSIEYVVPSYSHLLQSFRRRTGATTSPTVVSGMHSIPQAADCCH